MATTDGATPGWRAGAAAPIVLAFALALVVAALVVARDVVLLAFVAVLLAVAFSFPARWLSRFVPHGLAVVITLVLVLGALGALGAFTWPVVRRQAGALSEELPKGLRAAQEWVQGTRGGPVASLGATQKRAVKQKVEERVGEIVATGVAQSLPVAVHVAEGVLTALLLLILAAFLAAAPREYRAALRVLVPPRHAPLFDRAWDRVGRDLSRWVGGISVSMLLMGALTTAGLLVARVDGWLLLGALTLVATSVPYLGAISSAIPGLVVALAQGSGTFLAAAGVYLGVHVVEGYVVQPLIMKRAVELRPAFLLLGQAFFGALFGALGVVVATPLLVAARALLSVLWLERRQERAAPVA